MSDSTITTPHIPLSETALKACRRFQNHIDEFFHGYDYDKPTVEKERMAFSNPNNITGHQQRCFMLYWAAWAGDRGGVALDVGGAGIRHPYTIHSDIFRGKQPIYGGEVWPDIQCPGEDVSMFGDDCFEAIISNHLIEHLPIPALEVMKRWRRIIRPGGVVAGVLPSADFVDVLGIDSDHKQSWCAKTFLSEVIMPLAREGLYKPIEHDTFDNGFSFQFVIEKI